MSQPEKFIKTLWQTVAILMIALSGEVNLSPATAKIDTVQEHLAAVNLKLDVINAAIVNEERSCARLKPIIEEKFRLIEQRLEQLHHKYDELINQNIDNIDATQKSDLNIDRVPPQRSGAVNDDFRNRFSTSTTKSETAKIEHHLLRPTRNLTSSSPSRSSQSNNNMLTSDEVKFRQRQNRESKRNVNFINELLTMVNARLSSEEATAAGSMTDIDIDENSNNTESSTIVQPTRRRNKTISNGSSSNRGGGTTTKRKSGGIVFPNIKNRLAMMNATSNFISSIKRDTYVCEE